jgi:uncharacterized RDD family membrane protein YckC
MTRSILSASGGVIVTKWFIKRGDSEVGPGTEDQLKAAWKKGSITMDTLVRREGDQEWMTLRQSLIVSEEQENPFMDGSARNEKAATKAQERQEFAREMFLQKPVYNKIGTNPNYASIVERTIALLIDGFVLMIASVVTLRLGLFGHLINMVIGFGYFVLFQHEWGYTIGRKFMGIHVAMLSGQKPELRVFVVRYFMSIVSCVVAGIGYLMIAFSGRSQTLHDRVAQTIVVRDPKAR